MSDRPDTDPHELPDVDPNSAPPLVIPGPPGLPRIGPDETTLTPPPPLARDAPTPKVRLRREVAETLERAQKLAKQPQLHASSEPVNVVDALTNLMAAHEEQEHAIAAELAAKVDAVELQAAQERSELSKKMDALPRVIKEAATSVADRFLKRVDKLISDFAAVKRTMQLHEVRLTEIEKLNGRVDALERELKDVRAQLSGLVGDGK